MQIIDELEPTKRGPYAGVVGYFDFSGNLDTAIAIRTLVVGPDGKASVQAGAGIVADSQIQQLKMPNAKPRHKRSCPPWREARKLEAEREALEKRDVAFARRCLPP